MTTQPDDGSNAISRRVARGIQSYHRPGRLSGQVDGLLAQPLIVSLGAIAIQVLHDRVTQRMRAEKDHPVQTRELQRQERPRLLCLQVQAFRWQA